MPPHPLLQREEQVTDPVHYPVCDGMGESGLQSFVVQSLLPLLADLFERQGRPTLVGGNQFFYYKQGDPKAVVCPDLYVVDDERLTQAEIQSWKTWEHGGKAPALVLEVVSHEYGKDYSPRAIQRYQQLGVHELVRYDPARSLRGVRRRLTHFVRDEHGVLVPQPSLPDRIHVAVFDIWLVLQADRSLRLATGPEGAELLPTPAERAALEISELRARAAAAEAELTRMRAAQPGGASVPSASTSPPTTTAPSSPGPTNDSTRS